MVRNRMLLPLLAAAPLFFCAADASAYCVYNDSQGPVDATANVSSLPRPGSFHKTIAPKTHACCPWENRVCNGAGLTQQPDPKKWLVLGVTFTKWFDGVPKELTCGRSVRLGKAKTIHTVMAQADGYLRVDQEYLPPGKHARVLSYQKDHNLHKIWYCPADFEADKK